MESNEIRDNNRLQIAESKDVEFIPPPPMNIAGVNTRNCKNNEKLCNSNTKQNCQFHDIILRIF